MPLLFWMLFGVLVLGSWGGYALVRAETFRYWESQVNAVGTKHLERFHRKELARVFLLYGMSLLGVALLLGFGFFILSLQA